MAANSTIRVLNGPNLNMLGSREPEIYGTETLGDIETTCESAAKAAGFGLDFRQTNNEGELVDWIQQSPTKAVGVVLNAGAYTHTSIAVHDALRLLDIPVVEVHISNIFAREPFRHQSYVSPAANGVICGFGSHGYVLAIQALAKIVGSNP